MSRFKAFADDAYESNAGDYIRMKRQQAIYGNIQKNLNTINSKTEDVRVEHVSGNNYALIQTRSYDMLKTIHYGFYNEKQKCQNECYDTTADPNAKYHIEDLLYAGYSYVDLSGVSSYFDSGNDCKLPDFYKLVNTVQGVTTQVPQKYQQRISYPMPLIITKPT